MIDFGFDKIALIGAVALIVIGPQKLPRVARTVGHLLGKAQRYVNDVKSEVNRSMELDELRKMKSTVEDAALVMNVLAGYDARDPAFKSQRTHLVARRTGAAELTCRPRGSEDEHQQQVDRIASPLIVQDVQGLFQCQVGTNAEQQARQGGEDSDRAALPTANTSP